MPYPVEEGDDGFSSEVSTITSHLDGERRASQSQSLVGHDGLEAPPDSQPRVFSAPQEEHDGEGSIPDLSALVSANEAASKMADGPEDDGEGEGEDESEGEYYENEDEETEEDPELETEHDLEAQLEMVMEEDADLPPGEGPLSGAQQADATSPQVNIDSDSQILKITSDIEPAQITSDIVPTSTPGPGYVPPQGLSRSIGNRSASGASQLFSLNLASSNDSRMLGTPHQFFNGPKLMPNHIEALMNYRVTHPTSTLKEMQNYLKSEFDVDVCIATISHRLNKSGKPRRPRDGRKDRKKPYVRGPYRVNWPKASDGALSVSAMNGHMADVERTAADILRSRFPQVAIDDNRTNQSLGQRPALREPVVAPGRLPHNGFTSNKQQNVASFLIHATGTQLSLEQSCTRCKAGMSLYTSGCVILTGSEAGLAHGACGSCWYGSRGSQCSFHYAYDPNKDPNRSLLSYTPSPSQAVDPSRRSSAQHLSEYSGTPEPLSAYDPPKVIPALHPVYAASRVEHWESEYEKMTALELKRTQTELIKQREDVCDRLTAINRIAQRMLEDIA